MSRRRDWEPGIVMIDCKRIRLGWALAILTVVMTTACLGDGGYVSLGRQGGSISAEGATLTIEPEVLSSPIQFRIVRADPARLTPLNGPPDQTTQSDPFHFQTRGSEGMPATVSIPLKTPLPEDAVLEVYQLREGQWVWLTAALALPEGSAVALIPSLPATIVVVSPPPAAPQISVRWSAQAPPPKGALQSATGLHPLAYQVAADGDLTPRPVSIPSGSFQVIPVVKSDAADKAVIAAILGDEPRRQRHVDHLIDLAEVDGYAGLELDYRGLDLSLRGAFTAFVAELAEALHQRSRLLYLDVPLPERADGGWDDGAYDWRQLGTVVDSLVVYAPRDLSFYSARMGEVVRQGISQVERRKLRLGVNTSTLEKGPAGVRDISRGQALQRAAQIKMEGVPKLISGEVITLLAPLLVPENDGAAKGYGRLAFDQEANGLAFSYATEEGRYSVWIGNAQSLIRKLELAQRFRLGGVVLEGDFGGSNDVLLWQALASYQGKGRLDLAPGNELPTPSWQSSDGSLKEQGAARVTWRLPPPGSYMVRLCLNDGAAQGCQELSLTVAEPPPTTPTPTPGAPLPVTPTPLAAPTVTPSPPAVPPAASPRAKASDLD